MGMDSGAMLVNQLRLAFIKKPDNVPGAVPSTGISMFVGKHRHGPTLLELAILTGKQ